MEKLREIRKMRINKLKKKQGITTSIKDENIITTIIDKL